MLPPAVGAPVDISVFGGYFPFACRYSLDVPALFHQWGLNEIWREAYDETEGVAWLSAGAWDPCHFSTVEPIRGVADLKGLRIFTFPTSTVLRARAWRQDECVDQWITCPPSPLLEGLRTDREPPTRQSNDRGSPCPTPAS